jgi:prolyl-tRNA editing enzyme YbaK/EbsC (Cys-tRNA(Pro) deacylase)
MPVYIERGLFALPRIRINGGRLGYLVGIDPQAGERLLDAQPVDCALQA